jgi:hypothetical protein
MLKRAQAFVNSNPLTMPLVSAALHFDKPLCASKDGFTLHAATRAGALDTRGREAMCKYVLRPSIAQERITHGPDGLDPPARAPARGPPYGKSRVLRRSARDEDSVASRHRGVELVRAEARKVALGSRFRQSGRRWEVRGGLPLA